MNPFLICVLLGVVVPQVAVTRPAQRVPPEARENTRANVEKGTQIAVPKAILKAIKAKSRDCPEAEQMTAAMFEAYRFRTSEASLIAVKDRGRCGCSPTGNCSFGVYRRLGSRYALIMSGSMVPSFGFLKFKSRGFPDIVTWSHGSASMSGARLWQFDGKRYVKRCSRDVVFEHDLEEAQIENNTREASGANGGNPAEKH